MHLPLLPSAAVTALPPATMASPLRAPRVEEQLAEEVEEESRPPALSVHRLRTTTTPP